MSEKNYEPCCGRCHHGMVWLGSKNEWACPYCNQGHPCKTGDEIPIKVVVDPEAPVHHKNARPRMM